MPKVRYTYNAIHDDVCGYYFEKTDEIYIVVPNGTRNRYYFFRTLFHEFIHWIIDKLTFNRGKCRDILDTIFDMMAKSNICPLF